MRYTELVLNDLLQVIIRIMIVVLLPGGRQCDVDLAHIGQQRSIRDTPLVHRALARQMVNRKGLVLGSR